MSVSMTMTFKRIFPDLQAFQAWNQQVQISKTFQIFKAPYEPCIQTDSNHEPCLPSSSTWWETVHILEKKKSLKIKV
jgi:hypothetical protein